MCYANGGQRRAIAYHCENPASVALLLECSHDDYARKEG